MQILSLLKREKACGGGETGGKNGLMKIFMEKTDEEIIIKRVIQARSKAQAVKCAVLCIRIINLLGYWTMDYVYTFVNNVKYFYNSMNPATLSGAIDVIVVEQPDGTWLSTPFHIRFGKYGVFNYDEKYVDIKINDKEVDLKMKLNKNGVAFFADEIDATQQNSSSDTSSQGHIDGPQSPLPQDEAKVIEDFDAGQQQASTAAVNGLSSSRDPPMEAGMMFEEPRLAASPPAMMDGVASPSHVSPRGSRPSSPHKDKNFGSSKEPSRASSPQRPPDGVPIALLTPCGSLASSPPDRHFEPSTSKEQSRASSPFAMDQIFDSPPQFGSNVILQHLGLRYGSNEARFSVTTRYQGTAWCSCHIYLWKWSERLVISDIDGTITKSDVLGHVIPAIGGTWAHAGVAELYSRIKANGYKMVYLSSRAIGQAHYTKAYLQSIAQGSKTLPDGPVLLSPTSVISAFKKEVIERRPEEFKISCLTHLKSLFPEGHEPFFSGFGNRETDVKSYQAVGIRAERILIIDPSGMVRRADKIGYVSDYATMALDTVDYIFPPLLPITIATGPRPEFGAFSFWGSGPNSIENLDEDALAAYEKKRESSIVKRKAEEAQAKQKKPKDKSKNK